MLRRLTLPLYLLLPLLWLFRRPLFSGEAFAFRDSAFYYYPFYRYVQQRWSTGIPLWNPLDGIGQPLLGDPTAAVFYPPKLVFSLPLPYTCCFATYVVGHLLLGGLGAYCFARQLKANRRGSMLAGVTYQLSGHVLFQYCNPIYLVGAAWLPFALLCVCRMTRRDQPARDATWLGIVLSLMVLGGAPQMAMHTVLCAVAWCILSWVDRFRYGVTPQIKKGRLPLVLLSLSCLLAVLLAAVQVLPSKEWAARSDRASSALPRSILELGKEFVAGGETSLEAFWKRDALHTDHESKIYNFSVGPWRWSELFWPNISGQFGPLPTRWITGLPGEGRMWSASLYLGLLPLFLALSRIQIWNGPQPVRWLTWLTLLSMLAGLGEYGVGWILDEIRLQSSDEFQPSPVLRGFGGLYWFLTVTVPNYVEFRYPAKWWTITSLGISVLAAKGWPLLWSRYRIAACRRFVVLCLLVLAATLTLRFLFVTEIPPSAAFGPFDRSLATRHLLFSILHAGICGGLLLGLASRPRTTATIWAMLAVTAMELVVAQSWLIQTTPDTIGPVEASTDTFWRKSGHDLPNHFRDSASSRRFREIREHDLQTLMPKHHFTTQQRQLNSISSMQCGDFAAFWDAASTSTEKMPSIPPDRLLTLFGASQGSPHAWLVFDWKELRSTDTESSSPMVRVRHVLFGDNGQIRDLTRLAIVETDDEIPNPLRSVPVSSHECELVSSQAERVEVRISTDSPALLVMCDQFYPDWFASISDASNANIPTKIYRVNRVMRGVFVPAGESTVVFRYSPRSFYFGAAVSLVSWIGSLVFLVRTRIAVKLNPTPRATSSTRTLTWEHHSKRKTL